ncbi:sulfotransferase domain-containing protein [Paracoccus methylarcula]|uniref:Sulfotransferase n=1 Tax=Paracoccus methylarcula TaxID=72022 RepID=A0A3R7M721_9RHOB|nr:sulfotransferase domain-containing protein [Paracoccus methylarcula]RNF32793.1 sulfotransferase [Paracoccus methylarcula]
MRVPNFFIIGAQKSGTTYLAKMLAEQPDVFFSDPKEPLFFSRPDVNESQYKNYLQTHFAAAGDQTWVGEGSTTYLQWPRALENIKSYVPGTPKFIVCMRQPTEKAISFYLHNWRRARYAPGIRISDTFDPPVSLSPLKTSHYAPGLVNWLNAYPRDTFCFLTFDQLKEEPACFVCAATDFLGVPEPKNVLRKQVNAGFGLAWLGAATT